MGTEDDWGNNVIHDNYNSGMVYDLYNNSACDIMAVGNSWGTTSEEIIENHIVHQNDDPSLGLVTFIPFIGYDDINETKSSTFEVSPNPVSDGSFTISLKKNIPSKMTIYNVNGQVVKSQQIDNLNNTINVEALKSGVYFVEVKNNEGKIVKKIIIK